MSAPVKLRTLVLVACMTALSAAARSQQLVVDPMTCWWRTGAAAVRVGAPFSLVLTCSVIETALVKVVPDQSPLDPTVMQLPPFEVISGVHHPDLRVDDRR